MANLVDSIVSWFSPVAGVKREQARRALAYYEAARTNKQRKQRRETTSGSAAVRTAGTSLREQARHLDQNHDLARGVLRVLVNNIVGPTGIGIEPQPKTLGGELHDDFAASLQRLNEEWGRRPEVTWCHDWPATQRLLGRTWLRDGEGLAQQVIGNTSRITHGSDVPFSLECMEPDFLPFDFDQSSPLVREGIELNAWGRPRAYHLHYEHPGDTYRYTPRQKMKRVPAERMLHAAMRDRFHQRRGVSVFAAVLGRLDDVKDYEESESVAAKVAASTAAAIIKGAPDFYPTTTGDDGEIVPRELRFRPGIIFDDLEPGERVEMIGNNNRPNPALVDFRFAMLRAIAGGTGASFSSLAKFYDNSYSAQRQELVESWIDYAVLSSEFISAVVRPVYERLIEIAIGSGVLSVPADLDQKTIADALYIPPTMPWIDPAKEAAAWLQLEQAGHASGPEIIRRRGRNPSQVFDAETAWRRRWREADELITADPATENQTSDVRNSDDETDANGREARLG